jgi:hypothetical protein
LFKLPARIEMSIGLLGWLMAVCFCPIPWIIKKKISKLQACQLISVPATSEAPKAPKMQQRLGNVSLFPSKVFERTQDLIPAPMMSVSAQNSSIHWTSVSAQDS